MREARGELCLLLDRWNVNPGFFSAMPKMLRRRSMAAEPYERCVLREGAALPHGKGVHKVTARYVLYTALGEIRCVRVSLGGGHVIHFSIDEYERLFKPCV